MLSLFILSPVMSWTKDHDLILCREVANVNPYMTKKGSTQRSSIWEKIADTLNKCSVPKFFVDKRSVRDHVGILVNRHKKKLRDEEKASGITPDEPSELDLALDTIIASEESADAEVHDADSAKKEKIESDRAKAEGIRLKAMEKLSDTRKRESTCASEEDNSKNKRRRGSDAMLYLSQRAELNYELKREEIDTRKQQQEFEKKQMEVSYQQQIHIQQQQTEMLRMMHQQQQQSQQQLMNSQMLMMQQQEQQSKALMTLLEKVINK